MLAGQYFASPVPPEVDRALHARAWMILEIELNDIQKMTDKKIMGLLPENVS
jgi:hypothetical protein